MGIHCNRFLNLIVISILCLLATPQVLLAQGFSKKDLIGKWQAINSEKPMEMIFVDTITVYFKTDGNPALNNTPLTYSIDSIQNHSLLLIHFANGFSMKMVMWMKSKDEFRIFPVDALNYKDPLKDIPREGSKKIVTVKRTANVI